MFDSFRHTLAAWIAPEVPEQIEMLTVNVDNARNAAVKWSEDLAAASNMYELLKSEVAIYKSANAELHQRVANAATAIAKHIAKARDMREALMTARLYVFDVLNETEDEMNSLGKRSKQRPEYAVLIAAIKDDLAEIDAVLDLNKQGEVKA